jgi:hypothetical protein
MSEDVTIRAARAEQLLQDEVLGEALTAMFQEAVDAALRTDLSKPDECVAAVAAIKACSGMGLQLKSFITSGKAAERKPFKVA